MSDAGAIGLILSSHIQILQEINKTTPTCEYEYGIRLIKHLIKEIEKQGIDLMIDEDLIK